MAEVEGEERLQVVGIGGSQGGEILGTNRALSSDRGGPLDERLLMDPQPDVREHPRPPAVTIAEGVDLHGPVMDEDGLLKEIGQIRLPAVDVVAELGEVFGDVAWIAADREMDGADPPRPRPDLTEHLGMQPQHPPESKRGDSTGWLRYEVADHGMADILCLDDRQLRSGADMPFPQSIEICQRRLPIGSHRSLCPERLAACGMQFVTGAIDHRVELGLREPLALER